MKFHAFDIIWDNKMVERIKDNDAIPQANYIYAHTQCGKYVAWYTNASSIGEKLL